MQLKMNARDFAGCPVDENPPASVGDTGSIPGLGGSYTLQSTQVLVPQLLSLRSRAHRLQLLKPVCLTLVLQSKRSYLNEKPAHCNEDPPLLQLEKTACSNEDPVQPKIKTKTEKQSISKSATWSHIGAWDKRKNQ